MGGIGCATKYLEFHHNEFIMYTLGAYDKPVSSYKESCNNKPMYGYMLPNLSPSPNLYKVQSVYNNNVASGQETRPGYTVYHMMHALYYDIVDNKVIIRACSMD